MSEEAKIRALIQDWLASSQRGDFDHVLTLADEDLLFYVPGAEPFGKAAFAQGGRLPPGATMHGTADTTEVVVSGDLAYAHTFLDITFTAPDGTVARHAGHSLTIYRRNTAGDWQLWRDANLVRPVSV